LILNYSLNCADVIATTDHDPEVEIYPTPSKALS